MSKTFIINAIGFIGAQLTILVAGAIVGMVLGWDPKFAADVTAAAQAACAGFMARGWFC